MTRFLRKWIRNDRISSLWSIFMTFYSIVVYFIVIYFGYQEDIADIAGYRGYFQKWNWFLYPIFFIGVGSLIWFTWIPFLVAWREDNSLRAARHETIVRDRSGNIVNKKIRCSMINQIKRFRITFFFASILCSIFYHIFDTYELREAYIGDSYRQQLLSSCGDPDFFEKWIFLHDASRYGSNPKICEEIIVKEPKTKVWTVQQEDYFMKKQSDAAKILQERDDDYIKPPFDQIIVMAACYFQQFNIITMEFLILIQMIFHPLYFWLFGNFGVPKEERLIIQLDHKSKFEEFGLHSWNRATDAQYWILWLCLTIPLITVLSQPDDHIDNGVFMARILLVILVWLPGILTLVSRKKWLEKSRQRATLEGEEAIASFNKQKIWPFDDITMKAGGVLSVAWLGFIVGPSMPDLFKR